MGKKKSNGEGSIVKRKDGRYMARYTMGDKRYAIYGSSYAEVRKQLTETLAGIEKGSHLSPTGYTMSQWLREWLLTYALPTVKQSTYISYESYVRLHLEPAFAATKLTSLSIEQLQQFFNQKLKTLSVKSLRNIYNMLHGCLDQAVINGHLLNNPIHGVKLPSAPKKEISILSPVEQVALHAAANASPTLSAFGIIFTLSTGIRMGELIGLQWGDVDHFNHTIRIRRTVVSYDENSIMISSKISLPDTISKARLENGATVLMERLIKCIEDNADKENPASKRMPRIDDCLRIQLCL